MTVASAWIERRPTRDGAPRYRVRFPARGARKRPPVRRLVPDDACGDDEDEAALWVDLARAARRRDPAAVAVSRLERLSVGAGIAFA